MSVAETQVSGHVKAKYQKSGPRRLQNSFHLPKTICSVSPCFSRWLASLDYCILNAPELAIVPGQSIHIVQWASGDSMPQLRQMLLPSRQIWNVIFMPLLLVVSVAPRHQTTTGQSIVSSRPPMDDAPTTDGLGMHSLGRRIRKAHKPSRLSSSSCRRRTCVPHLVLLPMRSRTK